MMTEKAMRYWDILVNQKIATNDEILLVTKINGDTAETMEDILYVRTGYRYMEQYLEDKGLI